jgi:hypothetical protein
MLDARRPLQLGAAAADLDVADYVMSWRAGESSTSRRRRTR